MKHTLLITGFEPFQQEPINPSWEAVAALPSDIGPWHLEKLRRPTVFGQAAELALARAAVLKPQVILSLGQAGGREAVTPEVVAVNLQDARIPDNAGNQPQGEPIVPAGWDGYFTTLPVRSLAQQAAEKGFPCRLSYSAGTYVCNHVMYGVAHYLHQHRPGAVSGFVHIPYLPQQVLDKPDKPSMGLELALRGLTAGLRVMVCALHSE